MSVTSAMEIFNPDNGGEVALLAFVSLCGLGGLVLPVWITQKGNAKKLNQINDQVSNTHEENLRDEITRGFREMREDMLGVKQDIGGLREEIRTERLERIAGDKRRETAA
ncbi:hypothetical protein PBI_KEZIACHARLES14_30 [Mycobacterium phage Keziacharles14]|nr:hypothetical protein PBI_KEZIACHARLES14_30 [Mycobacterium phage Keziacharles14]